jgi:hypothetical protein
MNGLFAWSMRNGAKILFALALFELIFSFISSVANAPDLGSLSGTLDEKPQPLAHVWMIVIGAVAALHTAALPFFGAMVIDRLDRWRENRA